MNIIDALVVTLGLDTRDYEKGEKEVDASLKKLRETSDKQAKLIAEHGKKAAGAFSALKIEILGALAAFGMGAGFKAFIESSMNAQAATGRWSSLLKVSAHDMQAWEGIAKGMGGSAQDAVQTMQSLASGFTEATLTGTSALYQASRRYGFDISQNPIETLNNLHQRMLKAVQAGNPEQALAIGQAAGVHAQSMLFFLMQGQKEYQEMMQQMLAATGGMTKQSTEQAAKLQFQWALFEMRMETIRNKIFNKIGPVLIRLGDQLAKFLESVDWDKVIAKVGKFFEELQHIVQVLGGVKGILIDIAAIKVFGWIANIGMWILKLRSLTTALSAARAAAAAGGAAGAAAGAAEGVAAGAGAGLAAKAIPIATRLSMWALPIWALFHSESTGGRRRANGTYEDEFDWSSPEGQAAIAQQKAARAMQDKHREQALAYFTSHGWTPQQAAGIVANLTAESGLRANAMGDNGQAYGIAQWHKDRQQAFERFTGRSIKGSSFQDQLAFVNHELQTSEKRAGDKLRQADSAYSAGALVSMLYERPAAAHAEAARRAAMAQKLSSAYVGARPDVAQSKPSTTTNDVHIGSITVQTKATDANGVAMGMKKALRDNPLIAASVTALA